MPQTEITKINSLTDQTPIVIHVDRDLNEILIQTKDGSVTQFYHGQDCCETVEIVDINGDWMDLLGIPLGVAEERRSWPDQPTRDESETWTFYSFRSLLGSVDVRWIGSSNGYYSETVDIDYIPADEIPTDIQLRLESPEAITLRKGRSAA